MAELHHTLVSRTTVMASGCIEWNLFRDKDGYGQLKVRKKTRLAHRISYELSVGPIPPGLQVLHRCDNPPCVNPAHLFVGTHMDNVNDCLEKGRWVNGPKNGMSKLTDEDVLKIRADSRHAIVVAAEYRVAKTLIYQIWNRDIWKHLPETPRPKKLIKHKLTEEQVRKIKTDTRMYTVIAEEYGVAPSSISDIFAGRSWKHIP